MASLSGLNECVSHLSRWLFALLEAVNGGGADGW